ncbi:MULTISPECIES: AtpZ/AtpI family protein [unclassified Polaribacter]|uniref:AtpZ/AtpI family protein n=1 Tax=unclassified Polaribacter TaxID=196858 RepID=UPI0011BEEF4E|nr:MULTISPECIES: AtpZ/AtpI family protein [unclassified Polaribacter]TXD50588.1 AtpZ/AtpI family protein [Polaribacter sp. IC063]TXD61723.1 AtpZ/AtpI family protein [Polaribacter sp. IC066]
MEKKQNKNSSNKKETKKPLHKVIQLSGAGLQMGLIIYLGFLAGTWLDSVFKTNFLTETITLIAIFLAMYSLIKQANKIND